MQRRTPRAGWTGSASRRPPAARRGAQGGGTKANAPLRRAAGAVVEQIAAWAGRGESAPSRLLVPGGEFVEWAHYPQPDAVSPTSGWRFFYHTHSAPQRLGDEHGHFHIFVPLLRRARRTPGLFSHLIGITVDARGMPLRLFTTNRWVTDETWQDASSLEKHLRRPGLHGAEPADVARWLDNLLVLFAVDIAALLHARDRRLAGSAPAIDPRRFEDHRLRLPSQLHVNLARRVSRIDG